MSFTSDSIDNISLIEEFDKQCGEVFVSNDGKLTFLCTLCGINYMGKTASYEFTSHVLNIHRENALDQDVENIMPTKLDIESPELEDGFSLIDKMEFNCKEIEEYSALLKVKTKVAFFSLDNPQTTESPNFDTNRMKKTKVEGQHKSNSKSKARRYRCPKCDFLTKSYSTVMMHIARHMNDKRHFCQQCNKGFYTPNELRVHTRIHTNERPYLCNDCGLTFVTNSGLWRHVKSCKNIRDKKCPICELKFHDNAGLRNHVASVHSEKRSFKCKVCNASFKISKVLRNHMKIHENKHEFKCRFCPASFNQQPGLASHLKNKHSAMKLKEK